LKELLRLYILRPCFFISCLLLQKGHAIFLWLIILHSKLYSVCPSKYQDHSKFLKHLPINIWSATNAFMVNPCCDVTKTTVNRAAGRSNYSLILKSIVFTVCKHEYMNMSPPPQLSTFLLPWLMRSKMYPRWRTSHLVDISLLQVAIFQELRKIWKSVKEVNI
jgi:hypothetical protein